MSRLQHKQCGPTRLGPERSIVRHASRWLLDALPTPAAWTGFDVPIGSGSPDVLVIAASGPFDQRFRAHPLDSSLLAFLRSRRATCLDAITGHFAPLSEPVIASRIQCLARHGLLQGVEEAVCLTTFWHSVQEIVTIEAKVSDWKAAFRQADRNRLFATRSFVALPESVAQRVSRLPLVRKSSVGLLSVDEDGEVECLRAGSRNSPVIWGYYYAAVLNGVRYPRGWTNAL